MMAHSGVEEEHADQVGEYGDPLQPVLQQEHHRQSQDIRGYREGQGHPRMHPGSGRPGGYYQRNFLIIQCGRIPDMRTDIRLFSLPIANYFHFYCKLQGKLNSNFASSLGRRPR